MSFNSTVDSFDTILARSKLSGYLSETLDCVFWTLFWFIALSLKGDIPQEDFDVTTVRGLVEDFFLSFSTIDFIEFTDALLDLTSMVFVAINAGE